MTKPLKPGQHVIVTLRRMIASGELPDGGRIAEIPTAAALGVSRMPIRTALRALEQEGLVVRLGARGYAARGPSRQQIDGAVEVRGVLEGLAARLVADSPAHGDTAQALDRCLAAGDRIFAKGHLVEQDLEDFYGYNLEFHDLLLQASGNGAITMALARNNHLPFASATALVLDWGDLAFEYRHLLDAHRQHRAITDAIRNGDAEAAESLMRSHARISIGSASVFERFGMEHMAR